MKRIQKNCIKNMDYNKKNPRQRINLSLIHISRMSEEKLVFYYFITDPPSLKEASSRIRSILIFSFSGNFARSELLE